MYLLCSFVLIQTYLSILYEIPLHHLLLTFHTKPVLVVCFACSRQHLHQTKKAEKGDTRPSRQHLHQTKKGGKRGH